METELRQSARVAFLNSDNAKSNGLLYKHIGKSYNSENKSICTKDLETQRYILREKSLAMYFEDSQFRRNMTLNFIVSLIYVDKRSRVR